MAKLGYQLANPDAVIETSYNGNLCSPDVELGWILNPGLHPPQEDATEPALVDKNRQRRSGSTAKYTNKPQKRIAVFGCGYTYGIGVNDNETYLWQLNERYPGVWFDNYGVPGYGTYQCYKLMERVLSRHPQEYSTIIYAGLVNHVCRDFYDVYYDAPNDVIACYKIYREGLSIRRQLEIYRWPGDSVLHIANYLKHRYAQYTSKKSVEKGICGATPDTFSSTMGDIVLKMQALAEKHNAQFLFACLDDSGKDAPDGSGWRAFQSIQQRIKSQGTHFCDCSIPLDNAHNNGPNAPNNSKQYTYYNKSPFHHPNRQGHAVFAAKIGMWIDKGVFHVTKNNKKL